MGCSSATSKICLTIIGLIFWGAAAALIFLGAYVFHTYKHFDELTSSNLVLAPAGIVIIVGVFLFVLGCLGCVAAFKENKCLLAVLFSMLLIVLTALVAAGVLGYVFKKDLRKSVHDGLQVAIDNYNNKTDVNEDQVDYLQRELTCCGIYNSSDWKKAAQWSKTNPNSVPLSCCTNKHANATTCDTKIYPGNKDIHSEGCLEKLETKFQHFLGYIAGVAVAFAVIMLLGMICTCVLMCRSQEVRYEMLGGPNSGLRV